MSAFRDLGCCLLCTERFSQGHRPKVLGCGHSFCERCLATCTRISRLCPKCRAPITNSCINFDLLNLAEALPDVAAGDGGVETQILVKNVNGKSVNIDIKPDSTTVTLKDFDPEDEEAKFEHDNFDGKSVAFDMKPSDNVLKLMKKVEDREGIKPEEQRLIFMGKPIELDSNLSLRDLHVQRGSTIHLVHRQPGGGAVQSSNKMLSRLALSYQPIRQFSQTAVKSARFGQGGIGNRFTEQTWSNFKTRTGPTLKERLLGPTTGKPYLYGTYALIGASAFGIAALGYYGLGMSSGSSIIQNSALWPQYVRDRLHTTYGYLGAGLGITAAAGMAASRNAMIMRLTSSGSILGMFATLAVIIGTSAVCQSVPYENTFVKHVAWAVHCGALGAVLAPMVYMGGPALMRAAWYTAGLVAGLSATAITAPSEKFLMMAGPLGMGLGVVFVANIGCFFFPPHSALGASLASVVVYGGLILFSAFLLYNTQRLVKQAEMHPQPGYYEGVRQFDPINAQLGIYMNILNIFMRMAMITGGGSNRRK
ncbi:unnamed protein product, partial [Mesorhabditis spiculigera]